MDKGQAMLALKSAMERIEPLPDEPMFATDDETIVRYLKSADWKVKDAEKALLATVEYRRQLRPLRMDCQWCHERPGYHSMRQVGHDESGRPVIYANFAQAATHKNTVEDITQHVTYLIENAKHTMEMGVTTWVFVIDCTGMTLSACNPKLGYGMSNVLSNHYPERLGLVICVNHNPMFHGVWKALKKVIGPGTSAKVKMVRSASKLKEMFSTYFSDELTAWIQKEIELNKQKPLPKSQLEFWSAPAAPSDHDTRGSPSYVRNYLSTLSQPGKLGASSSSASGLKSGDLSWLEGSSSGTLTGRHKPHPNIVDAYLGSVKSVSASHMEHEERLKAMVVPMEELELGSSNNNVDVDSD